jgi:hypothetical protein
MCYPASDRACRREQTTERARPFTAAALLVAAFLYRLVAFAPPRRLHLHQVDSQNQASVSGSESGSLSLSPFFCTATASGEYFAEAAAPLIQPGSTVSVVENCAP